MKSKQWQHKNQAMKTISNEPGLLRDNFLVGFRATLSHQHKQSSSILEYSESLKNK